MLPLTRAVPKGLLPLYDRTVLDHIVAEARAAGIKRIVMVVGYGGDLIRRHFAADEDIRFLEQKQPLGTAHALACAREEVAGEPFALMLGDEVVGGGGACIGELMQAYHRMGTGAFTAIEETDAASIRMYNSLKLAPAAEERLYRILGFTEKPTHTPPSLYTSIGRYVLPPAIFNWIDRIPPQQGEEHVLAHVFAAYLQDQPFYGLKCTGSRYDLGDPRHWLKANVEVASHDGELSAWLSSFVRGKST
jgi:UTP--glucose-1-phosphate uridylyltransferase